MPCLLSVSRRARKHRLARPRVDQIDLGSCESEIFPRVEASSCESERSQGCLVFVCMWFLKGFVVRIPRRFWVSLVWVPDSSSRAFV
jgi:hypothetical protein